MWRNRVTKIVSAAFLALAIGGIATPVLAADRTGSTGACNVDAMMASVVTPNGGAMNMMNMAPEAMAQMMSLMASTGCNCAP